MKKKLSSSIITSLLIVSILGISLQTIGLNTVKADEAAAIWRFTYPLDWFEENGWAGETEESFDVCNYILGRFPIPTYEWTGFYAEPSKSTFMSVVDYFNSDFDYATVFLYGHGHNQTKYGSWYSFGAPSYSVPVEYISFWDSYQTYIDDSEIYAETSSGNHYFVVMWPCASGKMIGYYDADDLTYYPAWYYLGAGPSGMPFSWTHTNNLSGDGYNSPDTGDYCFIGFESFAVSLVNQTGYSGNTYGDFVKHFYNSLLTYGDSINDALDYASDLACNENLFSDTALHDGWTQYVPGQGYWPTKMRIYGNGDNVLPT